MDGFLPTTRYKLWAVGSPLNDGATGAIHVGIAGVAKKSTPTSPFIVVNEMLCNNLARSLLLPCPPGALIEHGGEPYFFSLNFNLAGQSLPPIPAASVVTEQPRECWGVIAFDVLVMNCDRHSRNIAYDASTKRMQIFDHSHALLGPNGDINARLVQTKDRLAIDIRERSGWMAYMFSDIKDAEPTTSAYSIVRPDGDGGEAIEFAKSVLVGTSELINWSDPVERGQFLEERRRVADSL